MNVGRAHIVFLGMIAWIMHAPPLRAADESQVKAQPFSLQLVPSDVTVWGIQSSQTFLVLGKYEDGLDRDVTFQTRLTLSSPQQGTIDERGRFVALDSGEVVLTATREGLTTTAKIHIRPVVEKRPFNFAHDIGTIFTRRGCNSTDCHGSVKGQGGYKLSANVLYPREDYAWTVEGGTYQVLSPESKGPRVPRIDLKEPENSLLLSKPTMAVDHDGGQRFEIGSTDYKTILNWLRNGAPYGEEQSELSIHRVEVFPPQTVLELQGHQQLLVTAILSNGRREDITDQVRYLPIHPDIISVTDGGWVQALKPGETSLSITAAGHSVNANFGVISRPLQNYPKVEIRNLIDEFVFAKLRKFSIIPSPSSTDGEFLRRVCLDLAGTLPPVERVGDFLADKNPQKREALIETLLGSPEYIDYWGFRFSDLLRVTFVAVNTPEMTKAYEDWVINSIVANKPYDQIARERIAAQGYSAPARNCFYLGELSVPEVAMPELVRVFMGRRMDCAQCHNHPYETWSQNQFWSLAAFFGGLTTVKESNVVVDVLGGGHVDQIKALKVIHPRTKEEINPAFLDGTMLPTEQWRDPRMRLAEWMTTHSYFAEAAVNRIWGYFFGRGIVEPVDDFRSTNPPTHPELLEALAQDFRDHDYDLKHLLRTIVLSQTYQLSGQSNATNSSDQINYSRSQPRPLEAAVLLDALSSVTQVTEKFEFHATAGGGTPSPGMRAMQMVPELCPSPFLDVFGRSLRKTPPSGTPQPSLSQALHMWAGTTYTDKISQRGGRLDRLCVSDASDQQIIEEFYLAALTRAPTTQETTALLEFIRRQPERRKQVLESFVWAVLSSREFAYNH
ncbi:MAG: DUF1549 and DUF1553 domain-containing protein [Planctomycetales bacterium]|nr:DUF1549 and DUF1553 domain-containing protein [Planctomycetales bacterium]